MCNGIVEIEITKEMKEKADERAKKKAPYTFDKWKAQRNLSEKEWNQLMGLVSHEAIKKFFDDEKIKYEDYDDIRTNGFKEPDQYDFKCYGKIVQIKSSEEKKENKDPKFLKENRNFPIEKVNGDVFIQVYFSDKKLEKAFIIVWIDKERLKKYGKKHDWKGVHYDKWCPLKYGYEIAYLKEYLINNKLPKILKQGSLF